MKWLITGAGGLLSRALVRVVEAKGDEVVAVDRHRLDVTNKTAVWNILRVERPDVVVQGAGYTAVDQAESEESLANRVNAEGAENVAVACQKLGCVFVYPSTDYVFAGDSSTAYLPGDVPRPINAYGRSKRLGELAVAGATERALIVRTSWMYGAGRPNFVDTISRLVSEGSELSIVDDQIGRPTWSVSLAHTICALLKAGALGTFHASDGGAPVTWAGFAREIVARLDADVGVRAISSDTLGRAAARPRYSVLDVADTERVIGNPMMDWRCSLDQYLREWRRGLGFVDDSRHQHPVRIPCD